MESQLLITYAEESVLPNLTVEKDSIKAALNDPFILMNIMQNRPLESIIIHIDEYQRYIDFIHHYKRGRPHLLHKGLAVRLHASKKVLGNTLLSRYALELQLFDVHFLHTEYTKVLVSTQTLIISQHT
ncbi:10393_t:CDS:2 [Funneliformis mosseae]|uniref:10393_t:CDS:1 n=1 Tax=Funneliformis mosseae TaxID=27381 RepID=A0A9N9A820_FUNMO|nr:10393_t:CDS:2 [Funneliformis mosseae]